MHHVPAPGELDSTTVSSTPLERNSFREIWAMALVAGFVGRTRRLSGSPPPAGWRAGSSFGERTTSRPRSRRCRGVSRVAGGGDDRRTSRRSRSRLPTKPMRRTSSSCRSARRCGSQSRSVQSQRVLGWASPTASILACTAAAKPRATRSSTPAGARVLQRTPRMVAYVLVMENRYYTQPPTTAARDRRRAAGDIACTSGTRRIPSQVRQRPFGQHRGWGSTGAADRADEGRGYKWEPHAQTSRTQLPHQRRTASAH